MAPRAPQYSTKASQPGVGGQLADLQKYGRSMTPVQWFGRTTDATPLELAVDNLRYSLPASTTPSTALLGRLLIPADSVVTVNMYGAAFDVTQDDNGAGAGNAGFSSTFTAINITGTVAFMPVALPTVTQRITVGAGTLVLAFSAGASGTATDSAIMLTATGIADKVINWHISADMCVATFNGSPAGSYGI